MRLPTDRRRLLLLALALSANLSTPADAQLTKSKPRILIAPNIRATRERDMAHAESDIASNPRDAKNLLGSATTFTTPTWGAETKAYASFDGGWTWIDAFMPDQRPHGAWDTQVRFGVTGTAYLLTQRNIGDSAQDNALSFYRSVDGGRTWNPSVELERSVDRNAIVVDNTGGRFHGRVYATTHGKQRGTLYYSSDDGRTFRGPVHAHCGAVNYLLVLTDGALVIPCMPDKSSGQDSLVGGFGLTVSVDGGETLQPFVEAPAYIEKGKGSPSFMIPKAKKGEIMGNPFPAFAVDTSARYRDRIYMVWVARSADSVTGNLMVRYTFNRGRTWSAARSVAKVHTPGASQFLPMVTVNRDGILGVTWFESIPPNRRSYDVFFTASVDGGDTFLPPRRVSSVTSKPDNPSNRAMTLIGPPKPNEREAIFLSPLSRFLNVGDYTGLTSDGDGVFHPMWPDARDGAYQLYTTRIEVDTTGETARRTPRRDTARLIDREIALLYEPPIVSRDGMDRIAMRLQNTTADTIWGPLSLFVVFSQMYKEKPAYLPGTGVIFNPETDSWGRAARIDMSRHMGDLPFLAPGATTEAVEIRFRGISHNQLNIITHVYNGTRTKAQRRRDAAEVQAAIVEERRDRAKQRATADSMMRAQAEAGRKARTRKAPRK